jgi:hypothetical protein
MIKLLTFFAIMIFLSAFACASLLYSADLMNKNADEIANNFINILRSKGFQVITDTSISVTVNPTISYDCEANQTAFIQYLHDLNISKVYFSGSSGYQRYFNAYSNDWSIQVHAFTPRPLMLKLWGT